MHKQTIKLAIAAASSLIALTSPAKADDHMSPKDMNQGVYVTVGAGGAWSSNPSVDTEEMIGAFTAKAEGNTELNGGFATEAGIGYDFGNSVRAELTYTYNGLSIGDTTGGTNIDFQGVDFASLEGTLNTTGTLSRHSVLVSGYYDIPTKSKFTPYVGGGLGVVSVHMPEQNLSYSVDFGELGSATVDGQIEGGSATAFGYQAKVGVSYAATNTTDLFVEGTYAGNAGVEIGDVNIGALNNFGARAGVRVRFGS